MTSKNGLDAFGLEALRRELHLAINEVFERLAGNRPEHAAEAGDGDPVVTAGDAFGRWTYTWPDKQDEEFNSGRWYTLQRGAQIIRVRLARTMRRAWGRDRERAIVFQQLRGADSYYPLVEFVETDDPGLFASPIPDPDRPRALLSEKSSLPPRLQGATVARADRLFRSIDNGPSLRIVVGHDDEVDMVRHGYWVARLRGRIPP
jgi:hypothetical protein